MDFRRMFLPFIYSFILIIKEIEGDSGDAAGVGSDPGPEVSALLGDGSSDGRSLHLTL